MPPIGLELLKPPTTDGSPAGAFASHKARTERIVQYYALNHSLDEVHGDVTRDNVLVLLAHLHAASIDPDFPKSTLPQQEPSKTAAPKALKRLTFPPDGGVGTNKDYDMVLKGLMTIRFRYDAILGATADHITTHLVPASVAGEHDPGIETVWYGPICTPETENHLLMIESSRYLVNQILHVSFPDSKYDNQRNGLTEWLLEFLQRIAKHDFLEFNSRPYAHYSLHSLFNLFEFASDQLIRTAAHILLDYTMMKFAVSSNRGRRVGPFRRHQHRINHQANHLNDLFARDGDVVAAYFIAYTGLNGPNGAPMTFPEVLIDNVIGNAMISGTSAYRPPPAAYIAALDPKRNASLHRFYHGKRPTIPCGEKADGGLEIYYNSPSFLLSAGGQFLNSGYGHDEYDVFKHAWEATARAQATTLIATKADTANFHDLLRFEPYPDPLVDPYADDPKDGDTSRTHAVNIGVGRGLAAGANLRPAERKTILEHKTSAAPAMTLHNGKLFIAWKGVNNKHINVAKVQTTFQLGIDGVEGVYDKVTVNEETDTTPAIASCNAGLLLVWKGIRNDFINVARSLDDGRTFIDKTVLSESTDHSPAVVAIGDVVLLAWAGRGNEKLNVARVIAPSGGSGAFRLDNKVVLAEKSDAAPTLINHWDIPFLAWKGVDNDKLNLMFSGDQGRTFQGKVTFAELSRVRPTLASHESNLFLAWTGRDTNSRLNVARVVLGESGIQGLEGKVVLDDKSDVGPALASVRHDERLFLAWKGVRNDYLNLSVSKDGSFAPAGPWLFSDLKDFGFFLAAYRVPVDFRNEFDAPPDNLAIIYAMEIHRDGHPVMVFATFRQRTMDLNRHLPAKFKFGARYDFHAPDGKNFLVWFQPVGWKYQARVVEADDPIRDLNTLPLVSGEYMQAPGDHDGLIEIRHDGCAKPEVVLDYREMDSPRRTENREACSDPWIGRSKALFESARRFESEGKLRSFREALADAADLYVNLAAVSSQSGQVLCPFVIQALADMRVDYSVEEAELHKSLTEPSQSGYASISHALLRLGARLRAPVFLNEIVNIYEHALGGPSPRKLEDVRVEVLKASVVQAFNGRHATQVTDFTECTMN